MNIVYIKSPTSPSSFDAVRAALRENCNRVRCPVPREMTLAEFSEWYLKATEKDPVETFDLHIVECSLKDLAKETEEYRGRGEVFLRDPDLWSQIIQNRAMGAILHASLGQQVIVFLYEEGEVTDEIQKLLARYERMTVKNCTEITNPEFIESAAYRCDCGLSAMLITPSFVLSRSEPKMVPIPHFISTIVTETFESSAISWWIFSVCAGRFGERFDAARTLCLVSKYARRTTTEQLEGIPLLFQAAIVPNEWWENNRCTWKPLFSFQEPNPRMSMKEAAVLNKLLHFSDGYSTLFIITEEGDCKALIDVGGNDQRTRWRLDYLREKIDGFIVSTDLRKQVWIHAQDERPRSPLILTKDVWRVDPSEQPVGELYRVLCINRGWRDSFEKMQRLVHYLSDERIGGFLILHPNPKEMLARLNGSQLRREIIRHVSLPIDLKDNNISVESLVPFLRLDGAHLFDLSGRLQLICRHLMLKSSQETARGAGEGDPKRTSEGGTKHAIAEKVAVLFRSEAIVIVISHDGPITVYAEGWKTTPTGTERY